MALMKSLTREHACNVLSQLFMSFIRNRDLIDGALKLARLYKAQFVL